MPQKANMTWDQSCYEQQDLCFSLFWVEAVLCSHDFNYPLGFNQNDVSFKIPWKGEKHLTYAGRFECVCNKAHIYNAKFSFGLLFLHLTQKAKTTFKIGILHLINFGNST